MNLVIFTLQYPYGRGETFLENDLKCASKLFDKIVIVCTTKKPYGQYREIPYNAEIISICKNISDVERIGFYFSCFFKKAFWIELYRGIKQKGTKELVLLFKIILSEFNTVDIISNNIEWIQKENAVYCSYWLSASAMALVNNMSKLKGVAVSRTHGFDCFYDRQYNPNRIEKLSGLDYIFPISNAGKMDLEKHYSTQVKNLNDKLIVSRLGVVCENSDLNLKRGSGKVIVSCSSIIKIKRLDILINALSKIEGTNITWIHFGTGTLKDDIVKLADEKLRDKGNINFEFKGQRNNSDIMEFYKNNFVDCFINCSDNEGIPVSAMEAMTYGIPVIARNVGGNSELVTENNGMLLPQNADEKDFARAIFELFALDDESFFALRNNAKKTIESEYNAAANYTEFYNRLISNAIKNK